MANRNTEVVVTNQIGSSGNENLEANEEIQKLRQQMIEMHRAWANGLPPPPFPTDNLEYLSSLPPVSHVQFSIVVDTLQHASRSTSGQHYPNTFNNHFLTHQDKTTTCSASPTVHVFAAPPPHEAPTSEGHPMVMLPHSTNDPVLNISGDQHYASEPTFKLTDPYGCTHPPKFPLNIEKPVMTEEQEKLRSLELAMKNFQVGVFMGRFESVSG
ncbi:hypothetical protein P3S68_023129 [Capsicum galapagoense]